MGITEKLRVLARSGGFKRFFVLRLLCQSGDGMFQAALATLFFFSAESQGSPGAIALALFAMLAPFTFVGPFVGVFVDRWPRRNIVVCTDSTRLALTVIIIAIILTWGITPAVYVLAMLALALNRFLLAALGAALPRVVESEQLLVANSILPTIGAAATGIGALVGVVLGLVLPEGNTRDAATLALAVVVFASSVAVVLGFRRDALGPDAGEAQASAKLSVAGVLRELGVAVSKLRELRSPARALAVMAAMRLLYGMVFVASILVARNYFSGANAASGNAAHGLGSFAQIIAATAVGFALAIVVTPLVAERLGEHRWIQICLVVCAAAMALITVRLVPITMLIAALLLGVGTQGAKIAFDTIIQQDTPDDFRGRAFVLYDLLFNTAFMLAGLLCAIFLPVSGVSTVMFVVIGMCFVVLTAAYRRREDRRRLVLA